MKKTTSKTENYILEKFEFLTLSFHFKKAILKEDGSITTISYLSDNMAIEIELDHRESDIFILCTKLSHGSLPKGYYLFEGKTVRLHLETILKEKLNINFPDIKLSNRKHSPDFNDALRKKIDQYQKLLQINLSDILENINDIF